MDNKKLGNEFEKVVTRALDRMGAWAHFIQPNKGGQQPFDIVAVYKGNSIAIDCKTCVAKSFSIARLEENQKYAFQKFVRAGGTAYVFVWHDNYCYCIPYYLVEKQQVVRLKETGYPFEVALNKEIQKIFTEDEIQYGRKSILR